MFTKNCSNLKVFPGGDRKPEKGDQKGGSQTAPPTQPNDDCFMQDSSEDYDMSGLILEDTNLDGEEISAFIYSG